MGSVVVDTHACIWYLFKSSRLSERARAAMEDAASQGDSCLVLAITIIEVTYLAEKRRILPDVLPRLISALNTAEAALSFVPIDLAVASRLGDVPRDSVPDMPDRIIAATALHLGLPLVTRDSAIRASGIETIW